MQRQQYSLIGYPLHHSMSDFIHNKLFELSGVSAEYSLFEIPEARLGEEIEKVKSLDGANVTIPFKTKIIPYLDTLSQRAALYSSVNVIANKNGVYYGYNTDCTGFLRTLSSAGIPLKNHAVVCGCGGVSRMMAYESVLAGCRVTIAVREKSLSKAQSLCNEILSKYPEAEISSAALNDLDEDIDILLNGTPCGMLPNVSQMPVSEKTLSKTKAVFDAIYNPEETLLLKTAASLGAKTAGGMPMLIYQAAAAQEIWNNVFFSPAAIEEIIAQTYREMEIRFKDR